MDWPRWVFLSADWLWFCSGLVCLAAAAALATGRVSGSSAKAWPLALAAGVPLLCGLLELAQYDAFQSMWDTGVVANLVWNVAHGFGLRSDAVGGHSYFGIHFTLIPYLLAPVLWLWESARPLLLIQGLVIGSSIGASYLLALETTGDRLAALALAALAASCGFFRLLMAGALDGAIFAPAFFLWGAYFLLRRETAAAVLCGALLLTTREQAPFALAGAGLFLAAGRAERVRGWALAAGAAAVWLLEMRLLRADQLAWANPYERWTLFRDLGGSPEAVLSSLALRPWLLPRALVWPPVKLWTVAKAMLALAALPLLGGAALWPALVAWLPNQLADATTGFHRLGWHYSAFVFGPLVFAAAAGLGRLRRRSGPAARRWALACVFAVAGGQFVANASFYHPEITPARWRESVPKALALIPPGADVWVDEYLLPQVGMRRHARSLQAIIPEEDFAGFAADRPDRVLMSLYWARRAEPSSRERVLALLRQKGLKVVFQDGDLVVWAR